MGLMDNVKGRIKNWLWGDDDEATRNLDYFSGDQRKPLKVKGFDDNVILNFTALTVWRSVSRMLRGGVTWKLPDGTDAQKTYLDELWRVNRKDRVFLQGALHAAIFGTGYLEIVPDAKMDSLTGVLYPRIIPLSPDKMTIETDPHDVEDVEKYVMEYAVEETDASGQAVKTEYRKVTRKAKADDYADEVQALDEARPSAWIIEYWVRRKGQSKWELTGSQAWPFPFPPIVHWKNLPSINDCYGISDIEDAVAEGGLQDKVNFVYSNNSAIVRQQAFKQRYTVGLPPKTALDVGPGKMLNFPADTTVGQLDATADMTGASNFAQSIRQALFDISREVDISSIVDKAGALTNFGLRVLNIDAVDKTDTKRQLYGEAIEELNHRLLVLDNQVGLAADPGKTVWGEALPTNILEDLQADQLALGMGVVSKQAVFTRYAERYGVTDWDEMEKQIADEQSKANANSDNIGATLLRNFNRGGMQETARQMMPQKANANGS